MGKVIEIDTLQKKIIDLGVSKIKNKLDQELHANVYSGSSKEVAIDQVRSCEDILKKIGD